MLTEQRKAILMERLRRDGRLVARALSSEFGVSEDTIRRDLRELAADGKLIRVHGGAMPVSPTVVPLRRRAEMDGAEKRALAQRAAALIAPGSVCFVDGGSTHAALMQALPAGSRFTLVTHSPGIAAATEELPEVTCILLGGTIYRHSMVALGTAALEAVQRMTFDLALIGATAFHPDFGLTTGDHEEARFKACVAGRAAATACVLTRSKIGAVSPFQILACSAIGTLVVPEDAAIDGLPPGVTLMR